MARSQVIRQPGRRFALLVEESVLRYRIGDVETMAGQLGYLLTVMSLPSVSLGVIPFTAPRRMWPLEACYIYDDQLVQVELLTADVTVRTPSEVGVYYAASKTIVLVQFVFFSVKAASAPRFSALYAAGDRAELSRFAGQTVRWAFWPALAIGVAALLAGNFLLSMFGPGFTAGYWVMVILFVGILAKCSVGPGEVLLAMAGEQKLCMKLYAVALAANLVVNVVLVPLYGIEGAALAAAGAMFVEAMLLHVAVRRKLSIVLFAFAPPDSGRLMSRNA